ncbi:MAG: hypothetical protein Fur0010_26010 [Bdellovibrio sp.]
MLKKDFHHTIVGSNYLSLMLAIEWLQTGRDVLVLDDDRMQLGDLFSNDLGLLEILYLKTWGEEKHIQCLQEIEKFAQHRCHYIVGDDVWIKLGLRPSENWREFSRRLSFASPHLVADFDDNWVQFVTRVAQAYLRYGGYQQITPEKLLVYAPPSIKDIYKDFKEYMKTPRNFKEEAIIRGAMGYYSKRVDGEFDEGDIFFLFISLFSPRFLVNQRLLVDELLSTYIGLKGHFKQTRMREWLFHKKRPWSVELSSYEGIIHPKQLTFVGSLPEGMPFALDPIGSHFMTLEVEAELFEDPGFADLTLFILTSEKGLGTNSPFSFIEFSKNKLHLKFLIPSQSGMKIAFVERQVRSKFEQFFPLHFPHIPLASVGELKMNLGPEVFVDPLSRSRVGQGQSLTKLNILDSSRPGMNERLKNVDYFGPFRIPKMGLFSSLVDLSIESQFS